MSLPNDLGTERELSELSVELASLKARLEELEHRNEAKSQARAALTALTKRYRKKEKLPSHPCGDILPYRYSSDAKANLGKDVIPIIVFVCFAKYLSKSQVEALAAHGPSLAKASLLLAKEEFQSSWFDCYMNWKKSNFEMAFHFFLEVTEAVKAKDCGILEAGRPDATRAGRKRVTASPSGVGVLGQKRQRTERAQLSCQPESANLHPLEHNAPHDERTRDNSVPQVDVPQVDVPQVDVPHNWSVQGVSSQALYGGQLDNTFGATGDQRILEKDNLDFSPLAYLPYGEITRPILMPAY
ncbi:Uu.00g104860.m01.CDS01 [Anthostomella pinea]|uniref:Uu.00g104860.m01.CDS01 n=1 Tax=Anthostomella pinea TaxID=933095 RepID=A0AAI8VDS3_9PEZI|nr:Uu.00g104860.m01.CDS01 [Anthostomella pinea]